MRTTWSNDWFEVNITQSWDGTLHEIIKVYDDPDWSFEMMINGTVIEQKVTYKNSSLSEDSPYDFGKDIFTGLGPIFEEFEEEDTRVEDAYYDGYNEGYDYGYSVGSDGSTPAV